MWGTENWGLVAMGGGASFVASVLYMLGGTAGFTKFLRRFVGSAVLALAANLIALANAAWHWQYILMYPCLIIGFSMGYGGDSTTEKILKRSMCAIGILSACAVGYWATGFTAMGLVTLNIAGVIGTTSVVMGVWNPFSNAPLEQYLICQVLTMFVPFWSFVR